MDYLFFDIECANCENGNGKICSFGYVLTDSDFKVRERKDILVNPKAEFKLGVKGVDFIKLAYPEEEFLKSPDFADIYPVIKELLEAKDRIIIGHAVNNDAGFLRSECSRYSLPCLCFDFADSQVLYKYFANVNNQTALERVASSLSIPVDLLHRSDEDAYLTMLCVKKMCSVLNLSLTELLSLCPTACGMLRDAQIGFNQQKGKKFKGINIAYFNAYYRRFKKLFLACKGKKFWFSAALRANYRISCAFLEKLAELGAAYTQCAVDADYVVCNFGESADVATKNASVLTPTQLLKCLGIDENIINNSKPVNYNDFLSEEEAEYFGADRKAYSTTTEKGTLNDIFDKNAVLKELFGK